MTIMTAEEEVDLHVESIEDDILLFLVDAHIEQTDALLAALEARLVQDLDVNNSLRQTRRLLTKYRNKNF